MRTLNLGILAHVDAGKTSLTERLLYDAGVIQTLGRVDDGTAHTDSLPLERARGITIRSAVASYVVGDVTVNLIDTPGHPDFIAEVERALRVLDGAVLVVSAVEGVQAQTRVLAGALQRLQIPLVVFVNKVDRRGARGDALVGDIGDLTGLAPVAMGSVTGLGTRDVAVTQYDDADDDFRTRVTARLAEVDDEALAAYVADRRLAASRLHDLLAEHTRRGRLQPVFFGSAVTGAGVQALSAGMTGLLSADSPSSVGAAGSADAEEPVSGTVFAIERGARGERIGYVRLFSGTLRVRERVRCGATDGRRITGIDVFDRGAVVPASTLRAGQIGQVRGLGAVRIGDAIGTAPAHHSDFTFPLPTLQSVVVPRCEADRGSIHEALTRLAEQDPLINLHVEPDSRAMVVSLYGEVQKEVIRDTLLAELGLRVDFLDSTTVCVERLVGSATIVEALPRDRSADHPLLAGLGLRVEPGLVDSGHVVTLEIERGALPRAFRTAIEDTIPSALDSGPRGWRVLDCRVAVVSSGYAPRQSHAHATFDKAMSSTAEDFRLLTRQVVARALHAAGTVVCEPLDRFTLMVPVDTLGQVLPALSRLDAVPEGPELRGSTYVLEGELPARRAKELAERLPGLTRGEGSLSTTFARHREVLGTPPARPSH